MTGYEPVIKAEPRGGISVLNERCLPPKNGSVSEIIKSHLLKKCEYTITVPLPERITLSRQNKNPKTKNSKKSEIINIASMLFHSLNNSLKLQPYNKIHFMVN